MRSTIALLIMCCLIAGMAEAAVESIGEINVVGDPSGQVPASAKVPLIITLTIDRSRAIPFVEDIRTFEILLPPGFTVQPEDVQEIAFDRFQKPQFSVALIGSTSVRLILADQDIITDTKANRIVEITFSANTPDLPGTEALFRVRMLNRQDAAIGEFIRSGNADQQVNNDDFTLLVIPNVPPPPPSALRAEPFPGENNVRLTWEPVAELSDHGGYFLYRDGQRIHDLADPQASRFVDISVAPGPHTYGIQAYKTPLLRSDLLEIAPVTVEEDTTPPDAPRDLEVTPEAKRVVILWKRSVSPDVVGYRVEFQELGSAKVEVIAELTPDEAEEEGRFEAIHRRTLQKGVFVYRVIAIDEAGLESVASAEIRLSERPYPNPFTPSSDDPRYNQVTFRATKSSDATFRVAIFDLHGTAVWSGSAGIGQNELKWDGRDDNGELVRGGIYVYQMLLGDEVIGSGTLIVLK